MEIFLRLSEFRFIGSISLCLEMIVMINEQ